MRTLRRPHVTNMPRISVGVPVRNGEAFLRMALDGILAQTYEDFEVIISDNASRDSTAEICQEYSGRDRRVRYFRQFTVLPPAANHNFVLRHARGEFFKWNCHDDTCSPEFLRLCLAALEPDRGAVLAYPQARIIDASGAVIETYSYPLRTADPRARVRFGSVLRADHRRYAGFEIYGLIRRDALASTPEMGNYVSADRVLLARLALLGRFLEVPEPLFFSREHGNRSVRTLPSRISAERKWLRRIIGVGALPPLEWWDPSKTNRINFPEWRLIREYCASLETARLPLSQRAGCALEMLAWFGCDIPKLGRDLLIAAERFLTPRETVAAATPVKADR
jgi:glycosyltransferase involved in cell wall biosynthesis